MAAIFTEHGWKGKDFIVSDIRKVMLHLLKYSLSVYTEGCSHYAEGGPRKHTDPIKHIHVDEAVMKCNIQQL